MTRQQSLLRKCVWMRNMLLTGRQARRLAVSLDRVSGTQDRRVAMSVTSQSPAPDSQRVRLFGNWVLGVGN